LVKVVADAVLGLAGGEGDPLPVAAVGERGVRPPPAESRRLPHAWEIREHAETAEWVNALPAPDGESLVRLLESRRRAGRLLLLSIVGNDGAFLGEIILFVRTPEAAETGTGEIAYIVAPAARGRGIATEAVRLLSLWALADLGLQRLQLTIRPGNASSTRVAEKAGYRLEGTLRPVKVIRGKRIDGSLYSLLPKDVAADASR
jgi:RimJ/RimL family protein N-acetyltransferase